MRSGVEILVGRPYRGVADDEQLHGGDTKPAPWTNCGYPRAMLRQRLLRAHHRLPLPRGYRAYRTPAGRIYLDVRESPMMLARVLRIYESEKHDLLRRSLRPGSTFVDAGANKGDFTLLAARMVGATGRVVAFEPEAQNCTWLRRSIELNGYSNIEVIEAALGEREGEAELHVSETSGWHTLAEQSDAATQTVTVTTLDAVLSGARADLIKIDVEGWELQVLQGAERTLGSVGSVTIDLHPSHGVDPAEVARFLEARGLQTRSPAQNELVASRVLTPCSD